MFLGAATTGCSAVTFCSQLYKQYNGVRLLAKELYYRSDYLQRGMGVYIYGEALHSEYP